MPRNRKTFVLVETPAGERLLVKSLAGHEGCRVIRRGVSGPPGPHCRLCPKGTWVEDPAAAEAARLAAMSRAEFMEEVLKRVRAEIAAAAAEHAFSKRS